MLDKAAILNASDDGIEQLHVPEWGGDVYLKTMSGFQRDNWEIYFTSELEKGNGETVNIRASLAAACLCNDHGELLFSHKDIAELSKKSGKALDRIYSRCLKMNRITPQDIDELTKN